MKAIRYTEPIRKTVLRLGRETYRAHVTAHVRQSIFQLPIAPARLFQSYLVPPFQNESVQNLHENKFDMQENEPVE